MRFAVGVDDRESVPGALARGVRINVLERSSVVWDDVGLPRRKAGLAQALAPDEMRVLAEHLGCNPDTLVRQTVELRADGITAFGDLHLLREDVDLERRCIDPTTLSDQPFHRAEWLIRLLPYCPTSLEPLVDACPYCNVALGWSRCWGIGSCERCRRVVPPSSEPSLPSGLADDYRLLSDLVSPFADRRRAAAASLPPAVGAIAPGTLIQVAVRLGQTCRPDPVVGVRRGCIPRLAPALVADILCRGIALLRDWPNGLKTWADRAFAERLDRLDEYHAVRTALRRLGDPAREVQAALVREALPAEFRTFNSSGADGEFLTAEALVTRTRIKPPLVAAVRPLLETRRLPGKRRIRSQLDVGKVLAFEESYKASVRPHRVTFLLKIPTYGVEQMMCFGVIEAVRDEAVRIARHGACITRASVEALTQALAKCASRKPMPAGAVPLIVAARRIGGQEKPWGLMMAALRDGGVAFWLSSDNVDSRSIVVAPDAWARFDGAVFDRRRHRGFPFATTVNRTEAEEILNIPSNYFDDLVESGLLTFSEGGRKRTGSKDAVVRLARQMAVASEIAAHGGGDPNHVRRELQRIGVPPLGCGWSRRDLVRRGLLPSR